MNFAKAYVIYGKGENAEVDWIKWIESVKKISDILQINPNMCSVFSKKGNNIQSIRGLENKIRKLYQKGDTVENISFYLLPENFTTIIFDFAVTITRRGGSEGYSAVILNTKYSNNYAFLIDEDLLVSTLKDNLEYKYGEFLEMDIAECPELYMLKANPDEAYKSLKIIRSI